MSRRKRYVADPESQVFGLWALALVAVIWLVAWPWGLVAGPGVWFFAIGMSVAPGLFAFMLLVFPLFDKYNWERRDKEEEGDDFK